MAIELTPDQLTKLIADTVAATLQSAPTPTATPVTPVTTATGDDDRSTRKKPDRPALEQGVDDAQWQFFLEEWSLYKRMTKLQNNQISDELRLCCSRELRRSLFDFVGTENLTGITEDEMLIKMKSVAVISKNLAVHRREFHMMAQSPGEQFNNFVSRLRSKARHCEFTQKCTNAACTTVNNYSEAQIMDQMVSGLYDEAIQCEVLSHDRTLTTFDDKFQFIEGLEKGRKTKSELHNKETSTTNAFKSTYRREKGNNKTRKFFDLNNTTFPCRGCGTNEHNPAERYSSKCRGWGEICSFCGKSNHLQSVCSSFVRAQRNAGTSTPQQNAGTSTPHQNAGIGTLQQNAGKTHERSRNAMAHSVGELNDEISYFFAIGHLEWDGTQFTPRQPDMLPSCDVKVRLLRDFQMAFRSKKESPLPPATDSITVTSFTDTCAQTCVSGIEILEKLGITESDLIPTRHKIISVTSDPLNIKGVALVEITANGKKSYQTLYVSEGVNGFFITKKAQIEIGVLPSDYPQTCFPASMATYSSREEGPTNTPSIEHKDGIRSSCGCLKRTKPPPRPSSIPFEPTPENREKLENWIKDYYASSAFNKCEHTPLPKINSAPMKVHFREDAEPVAVHKPIPVSFHWKKKVKSDLDRDVALQICEPVPQGVPAKWCSRMLVVPKTDGRPRRTVDYQALNKATYRETHHTPPPFHLVTQVPSNTKKTTLDAWEGYHSLPLCPLASDATSFITEWGRYRYLSAPQGYHASGDGYTKAYDDITKDTSDMIKIIDDSCHWKPTIREAFWETVDYLTHCYNNGIIFNPEKFHFAKDEVDFAGFTITNEGIRPTDETIEAIANFPKPTSLTDIRAFFGLVNQVAYTYVNAGRMQPFRELLKGEKKEFYWDNQLDMLFEETKKVLAEDISDGVRNFVIAKPLCICTDYSKSGLGFILLQKHCSCDQSAAPICCPTGWKAIYMGSRFTTPVESELPPIEGEAIALGFGLEKCKIFLLGCDGFLVVTDHKPLVRIFNDKAYEKIDNERIFAVKEKTAKFKFTVKHIPGKANTAADTLSRYPSRTASAREQEASRQCAIRVEVSLQASLASSGINPEVLSLDRINEVAGNDKISKELRAAIINGFPETKSELSLNIQPYWTVREDLSVFNNVPTYDRRVVIPKSLRTEVLEHLHSAHQGVTGMRARAQTSVYWPGMDNDIRNYRLRCRDCNDVAPSLAKEPIILSESPDYPFQKVVADYFELKGFYYIIYADRYSGWPSIIKVGPNDRDATFLIKFVRDLFTTFGAPDEFSCDEGSTFTSNVFKNFLKTWGVRIRLSSAYYAQSNGRAELAVKVAKRILMTNCGPNGDINNDNVARALLSYRNTPLQDIGASPAHILFGRTLKDFMPIVKDDLQIRPEWKDLLDDRERALRQRHVRITDRYNEHTHELGTLDIGEHVAVQNQAGTHPRRWDKTGIIVESIPHRQYLVRMDGSGRVTTRNRKFLREIHPVCADSYKPPRGRIANEYVERVPTPPVVLAEEPAPIVLSEPVPSPAIVDNPPPVLEVIPPRGISDHAPLGHTPSVELTDVRRSHRSRQPRQLFQAKMAGKDHSWTKP